MKIAIVRGAFLNPYECQLYTPLARNHDLTLIGADWQFYPHPIEYPGVKVRQASLWGASASVLHRLTPVIVNRTLSWTTGRSFGFYDLERLTAGTDVVHSAETFFTMTHQSAALKRAQACALVITVSENLAHMGELHPWRRRLKMEAIQSADHMIAITETARRTLLAEGVAPDRITVIPWSLDLSRFHPAPKDPALLSRLDIGREDPVVLFVGRFIVEKGIRDLLECISQMAAKANAAKVRFLFVGEGPLASEIDAARRRHPELIRRHPFVSYDQLPAIHNLADIFVLPSKAGHKIAEQFGFVLIESMACGKPIITTSVGSITDVVGDAALLTAPGKPDQLALAVTKLLESSQERDLLSRKALDRARNYFDADINARRLESIYTMTQKRFS